MDFQKQKAIYRQIADFVCDKILSGEIQEGGKLSSVRELAVKMEVNVNTIARTFEWLQWHGIIEARRGMGNYVATGAQESVVAVRREEFYDTHMPQFFRAMRSLGISMDEVVSQYAMFND